MLTWWVLIDVVVGIVGFLENPSSSVTVGCDHNLSVSLGVPALFKRYKPVVLFKEASGLFSCEGDDTTRAT